MSWSWTLYRYLALRFLGGVGMVYGILLALAFSIGVVDLFNRTGGSVDTGTVIGMAVLQLPDLGLKMLPFALLFGGVYSFMRLARNHELVASRAAGISAWDFLMPALVMAVLIGIVTVTAVTPVASRMFAEFASLEARHIKGQASLLDVSGNGVWLRQGDEKEQSVIHASTALDQGERLENVVVLLYRGGDRFSGRIDAASARLLEGHWELRDAWVSGGDGVARHHDSWQLATTLTAAQIEQSLIAPTALSFWNLPGFIRTQQSAGFSPLRYQLYFYTLCALPALFAAMVFMAASFSLRPAREGGMAKAILLSVAAGFAVYFFERLTETLGRSGAVPVLLAATAPAIAAILIGMTLVFSREDG